MRRQLISITLITLLFQLQCFSQDLSYDQFMSQEISGSNQSNSAWAQTQPYVIMISIDGFRYDYAQKFGARNILKLMENGASARKMFPSFPSKTFPNHYTLITGLRPGAHGLVGNKFYSRERDAWYNYRDKQVVRDGSWYSGTPLWVLAEQQGMKAASLFWVGSEANIAGVFPSYYYAYNGTVPNEYRIRKVLDWLNYPVEKRPHFITTYFSVVDDAGHAFGPEHENTRKSVLEIDALIGQLLAGLEKLSLPVNLILVSDHGMAEINHGIVLPELVDLQDAIVSYSMPSMIYQPDSAKLNVLYNQLVKHPLIDVYKRNEIPDYLQFVNEDRIGDLVLITHAPTILLDKPERVYGGTHGFDPYRTNDMGALFVAYGAHIRSHSQIAPFENIHVYPFVARLLGLKITTEIDGNPEVLNAILKDSTD